MRHRTHRQMVRFSAHRHPAGRDDAAKGLGSGVPIGACLTAGKATGIFQPGNHGSTFGGNPLACTAGLTTLNIVEQDKLLAHAEASASFIRQGIATALQGVIGIREMRGQD